MFCFVFVCVVVVVVVVVVFWGGDICCLFLEFFCFFVFVCFTWSHSSNKIDLPYKHQRNHVCMSWSMW